MIYVGIDDTDMPDAPGTNKLARALAADLGDRAECVLIVRHQLLEDPRVPCTSKNSAACLLLRLPGDAPLKPLIDHLRRFVEERSIEGSDPGLCVATRVPAEVTAFGERCKRELVTQQTARRLAAEHDIHLEGLGGDEDGVIGALAAVGLAVEGNDGRVVHLGAWPDDLAGPQDIGALAVRGVEVRCLETQDPVRSGLVDVGKHLRPAYRDKRVILFANPAPSDNGEPACWQAVRLR